MQIAKRVALFLVTNILVLVTVSIAFTLISHFTGLDASSGYLQYMLVFCAVWGMGGAFISLLLSKVMAKWMMRVKIIDPNTRDPELKQLIEMVHNLARKAQLPKMPEVGMYDSPEVNAFATGPSKRNSLVAVSSGLLQRMNRDEVEGVLAHEVSHISNGDMVTMTLIQGVVNAFVMFFARIIAGLISQQLDEKIRGIAHIALIILFDIAFAVLGSVVVAYFSRAREFRADYGGAKYAGREKMIAALRRLQGSTQLIETEHKALSTLKISSKPSGFVALFSTHPPLEERIRTLERASIS